MDQAELDKISRNNAFMLHNHIRVRQTGPDSAEAALDVGPDSLNPYGLLHGGAYYTMADCAAGCAARADGRRYVTLHGGVDFIRSAGEGRVVARSKVRHRGRSTCLIGIEITGGDGVLLATGDFTFFCTGTL